MPITKKVKIQIVLIVGGNYKSRRIATEVFYSRHPDTNSHHKQIGKK